jgi:hypothetical protein
MTVRDHKRMIRFAAAVVGLASLVVLVVGFATPVVVTHQAEEAPGTKEQTGRRAGASSNGGAAMGAVVTLEELRNVCAIDLRRPLVDGPAPVMTAAPAFSVSAMFEESGHSVVVLTKPGGATEMCAVGDSFNDARGKVTVRSITSEVVTLECSGCSFEVCIPPHLRGNVQ